VGTVSTLHQDFLSTCLTFSDDWHATYHRIPKAVNDLVAERGGNRLCEIGVADSAQGDIFNNFDSWGEAKFWPGIRSAFPASMPQEPAKSKAGLQVEVSSGVRASTLGLQVKESLILENRLLTSPDVPAKRLVRFQLPSDTTYQCGDYLAVLPVNPSSVVRRAIRRFGLPWDAVLRIQKPSGATTSPAIPLDVPISAFELLSTYVELSQPASKRDVNVLAEAAASDADTQAELRYLASSPTRFTDEIVKKRVSPLDLLLRYPSVNLSIGEYLMMLPPMRVRQYSISSSPLQDASECSITLSVLNAPAFSSGSSISDEDELYLGVASTYLANLKPGELTHVSVRPSNTGFRPSTDLKTPMIMACAGSGLAPFRGFIMDRAEKIRGRRGSDAEKAAKAILYAGCRTKGKDDIHADELAEWERLGAVEVRWAYSRPANSSEKGQHIQDLMRADRDEIVALFGAGARIYVCGSTTVGNAVRDVCREIFLSERQRIRSVGGSELKEIDDDDEDMAVEKFFERLRTKERFVTDVFT
jgi:cytochrome P450/NADPH-cytochrome P450 reductase